MDPVNVQPVCCLSSGLTPATSRSYLLLISDSLLSLSLNWARCEGAGWPSAWRSSLFISLFTFRRKCHRHPILSWIAIFEPLPSMSRRLEWATLRTWAACMTRSSYRSAECLDRMQLRLLLQPVRRRPPTSLSGQARLAEATPRTGSPRHRPLHLWQPHSALRVHCGSPILTCLAGSPCFSKGVSTCESPSC